MDSRVSNLPDTRPLMCKYKVYDSSKYDIESKNISLILVYNDYEFYELKKTVESLLMSGSLKAIKEIIVVDDSSSLAYIQEEAHKFFALVPNAKIFRSSLLEPMGLAKARNMAASVAKGDILLFLGSNVVVGNGWLDPLIKQLQEEPEIVVVPHMDHIKDPVSMAYIPTPDDHTYTLTWSLSIRPFRMILPEAGSDPLSSPLLTEAPALRGDVFAIRKDYFAKLGGYDPILEDYGGGEHVDLTLKAWLCGSGIKTVHCSRVGVINSRDPAKVRSEFNRKRLADFWFPEKEMKSSIFRLLGARLDDTSIDYPDVGDQDLKSLTNLFSSFMNSKSQCIKNVKWYVDKVAINMVPLRNDAIAYGILKTGTNRCAHLLTVDSPTNQSSDDGQILMKVKLDECKPAVVEDPRFSVRKKNKASEDLPRESEFVFQLTKDGAIMVGDRFCLTTKENGYLVIERCSPTQNDKQRFRYKDGQLINVWCGYCAMQVTDPSPSSPGDKQIAMVQTCNSYSDQEKSFKTWTFINL